jgi:phage virion morphogenesis protein
MARIAARLNSYIDENFKAEGRPKWKPLNPLYEAEKRASRGVAHILQTSGALARSVQPNYGKAFAQVSTNKIYAAIHHYGGEIKPKPGAKRSIKFAMGGRTFIRRKITIPARPFMTITDEDEQKITTELQNFIAKKLGLRSNKG